MASVRLDPTLESQLSRVSRMTGKTVSAVIREAVEEHCYRVLQEQNPLEALKDYIGAFGSGGSSDSSKVSEEFGEILDEKRRMGRL